MPRLLVVSNRLPVTVSSEEGAPIVTPSTGGLATGLSGPHERSGGLWIGWPGDLTSFDRAAVSRIEAEMGRLRLVPVSLTSAETARHYAGFSNGVLWPLFHYMLDRVPLDSKDWAAYRAVNEKFADKVAALWKPGDLVWVHDYQLMLLPQMLRERLPMARIGFFLHIPFPAAEVFRILPWRADLLRGLLGADVIGFHTLGYVQHFEASLLNALGIEAQHDDVFVDSRRVRVRAFPMGIDARSFAEMAEAPTVSAEVERIRAGGGALVLGIDRLDYTKGIRRRLLSVARLFERHPHLRGRVSYLQVAVPSRAEVGEYAIHRAEVDGLVGRINGAWSTVDNTPVRYLYRGFTQEELVPLYRAADVMLVTPLRDGMNLVAKEFAASRSDEDGVLVLSELAGAADELSEALLVNPYDVDAVADAITAALELPRAERKRRMRALRKRVFAQDVHTWASSFLDNLRSSDPAGSPPPLDALVRKLAKMPDRVWMLDYDGTLVPFSADPADAAPDVDLLALLARLSGREAVHIVSGRSRETLEDWFGGLGLTLHAEHGACSRTPADEAWSACGPVPIAALQRARALLSESVARTPGAWIEEKPSALAWHYRAVDPQVGAIHARELHLRLVEELGTGPLECITGEKVLEVRIRGVHKGLAVPFALQHAAPGAVLVAIGDDRTDEDLFGALRAGDVTIKVGAGPTSARHRLAGFRAVRQLLAQLLHPEPVPVTAARGVGSQS